MELFRNNMCSLRRIFLNSSYGLATNKTYEFDLLNKLSHGGSKGIYLELWIEYFVNGSREKRKLGTFKTLHEDDNAMHVMAGLLAD